MAIKIIIHPAYEHLRPFISRIPETFSQEGITIYKGRNEIRVVERDGLQLNIKQFGLPLFINRIVYSYWRKPKAERAYNYALKLQEKGINTPAPVAYIRVKNWGLLDKCYFASLQVPYSRRFYEFGTPPIESKEDIIRAFAHFTAYLHTSGIYHKDYSPGNILFDIIDGKPEFCIVDINRMVFGPVNMKKGCANFARLWGQKPFFLLIAEEYANIRHFDVNMCKKLILRYRKKFWKQSMKKYTPKFELDL